MTDIKYMDLQEFINHGYLQELNRQFLHPLGLALEVTVEDDGTMSISGVWDSRSDPDGIIYGDGDLRPKALAVAKQDAKRRRKRVEELGYWVQPVQSFGGP